MSRGAISVAPLLQFPFPNVDDDFSKLAESAPKQAIANGLTAAFRADDTPAFAYMVVDLFTHFDVSQRAGFLTVWQPQSALQGKASLMVINWSAMRIWRRSASSASPRINATLPYCR
jgi:hypothetical protein